ncbi:TonB-dependent receptor family protein [Methylocucumis oryzae]|uniref:TonB-dependent receptor family protein n=1 Tax=Methylocucumis oryzae TaxID=1632867 RepID=UPI000AE05718|nr:TonB-dependent receptor [Methylocucumis oryzae]
MNNNNPLLSLLLLAIIAFDAMADEQTSLNNLNVTEGVTTSQLPTVEVVGESNTKGQNMSGSVSVLDKERLFIDQVFTVNEALRKTPGVYVRDEEGFGIRPNIGIRGMNPFRSTKVLFLEDGLPFNYAPYGDNDIYYHPPIERYDGVEIFKGADLTQFGPQTINGAINYLTPQVPTKPGGFASFTGGNRDYLNGHLRYGGMANKVSGIDAAGGVIDYIHKEGQGARDNTFVELDDVNLKSIIDINSRHRLTFRGDFYQEDSQSTFGLTEAEYRNFGARYNPFKNDRFTTERWATSATHEYYLNNNMTLSTSFYWTTFHRDFWRQMNQQPTDLNCDNAGYVGYREQRLNGEAINVDSCNFTRGRLRNYDTWGITPTLHASHQLFGIDSELDVGFRAHFESQYRTTVDGSTPTARSGMVIENSDRFADAYAGFMQNKFIIGRWTATPGVRVESVSYERINNLPGQQASGENSMTEPLPSFSLTYSPIDQATLFFGFHRGFAPPRVEDSVYNNGNSVEIGPEKSWNYEVGVRSQPLTGMKTELTFFP